MLDPSTLSCESRSHLNRPRPVRSLSGRVVSPRHDSLSLQAPGHPIIRQLLPVRDRDAVLFLEPETLSLPELTSQGRSPGRVQEPSRMPPLVPTPVQSTLLFLRADNQVSRTLGDCSCQARVPAPTVSPSDSVMMVYPEAASLLMLSTDSPGRTRLPLRDRPHVQCLSCIPG